MCPHIDQISLFAAGIERKPSVVNLYTIDFNTVEPLFSVKIFSIKKDIKTKYEAWLLSSKFLLHP